MLRRVRVQFALLPSEPSSGLNYSIPKHRLMPHAFEVPASFGGQEHKRNTHEEQKNRTRFM